VVGNRLSGLFSFSSLFHCGESISAPPAPALPPRRSSPPVPRYVPASASLGGRYIGTPEETRR